MELAPNQSLHGFTIQTREDLPELEGTAYIGIHDESKARLLLLCNDDNNKSFSIGFRTPPKDDTGVFHILEHSVLCGSKRFPVKEPFVDLLKGSMQTFLNAMTFADKTLYPVASTNEQDLFNLMDVYLDAVFHPRIYEKRAIFEQEGWHYELRANDETATCDPAKLTAQETTLSYNGVVFNEMKGALSDATSVLYDELQKSLLPDTCYAFESGGTPEAIPTLTYENYLDEHRRHYRTDNSYIILYGNLDVDRALEFLDERYLTPVAQEQRQADEQREQNGLEPLQPRTIELQQPLRSPHRVRTMVTAPENACSACGYVIGNAHDRIRALAAEILLDALFGSNEAPLKRALLDQGVAHDVSAFVSDALLQPFAVVQLQMPAPGAAEQLMETISRLTQNMLEKGLDKSLVEAALAHAEFQMREHDMGYADGVIYAMVSLSSWLYDEDGALDYLRYESAFAELRANLQTDYFERLCRELLCDCSHAASVEVVPQPQEQADASSEKLRRINEELTQAERAQIVEEEALLRELQEAPDSPEAIATLPRLSVADIQDAPEEPRYYLVQDSPLPCLRHDVATRGIVYAYRYYDIEHLEFEDLPYLSILALVLGKLDTAKHTAAQIDTLVQGTLGNLSFFIDTFEDNDDPLAAHPKFIISSSALSQNVETLAQLPLEIMTETDFSNKQKILDLLKQRKIMLEQSFASNGHSCAAARCKSYYMAAGVIGEQISNVDFYRFVCDLIERYDEQSDALVQRLEDLSQLLFVDDACFISFAGEQKDYESFWAAQPARDAAGSHELAKRLVIPKPEKKNEAFTVPTDVCYAALGYNHKLIPNEYRGSWTVAARALSLDYLWNEVRVKGGAYGTGFQALRTGNMRFYSYRDPHLDETLERFSQAVDWLASFSPAVADLEGFIVASVAAIDAPVKPRLLIRRQTSHYFGKYSPAQKAALRRQVIESDVDALRSFAVPLKAVVDAQCICVFGNRDIIESASTQLEIIPLVG